MAKDTERSGVLEQLAEQQAKIANRQDQIAHVVNDIAQELKKKPTLSKLEERSDPLACNESAKQPPSRESVEAIPSEDKNATEDDNTKGHLSEQVRQIQALYGTPDQKKKPSER